MALRSSLTGITNLALGNELSQKESGSILNSGLRILSSVSFFLVFVCLVFLLSSLFVAYTSNNSLTLFWFFAAEAIAFALIPFLAGKGFENTAKFLLITYVDIGIIIMSSTFGGEVYIQAFFIPAMGLAILLFDYDKIGLRNLSILLSILSYFLVDYVILDRISLTEDGITLIRSSVLIASFVTTWLIFNTFSESKQLAESQTRELLEKEQELNKVLNEKQEELEEYIDQLEVTSNELEQSTLAKSKFLATMSHEIRTPMNAILGMAHMLKQDDPREDQLESINILDFSCKTLLTLIDDVLDFSKIEAGKIEFEQIEFGLNELVSTIIESFKVTANNKGVKLYAEIGKEVPNVMIGDPARLTQILNNLVSNALKFTEEGEVRLSVNHIQTENGFHKLEFEVQDSGIGIEENRLESIFESFTQANTQTKRLFGGTGLGLSISKQLAELQGGSISVESTPDEGSTFKVTLSFEQVAHSQQVNAGILPEGEEISLEGIKILLAEDNLVNQRVMHRFLERWDVELTIVDDGEQVVDTVRKKQFDVILMDLQMPKMDGYEATFEIRKMDDAKKRNIPIIALTAAALKEVRGQVFAAGMNGYITKPFNPVDLKKKLAEAIAD